MSLKELERRVHASDSALSRYLTGRSLPPWIVVEALCRLAGRDPGTVRPLWAAARSTRAAALAAAGRGADGGGVTAEPGSAQTGGIGPQTAGPEAGAADDAAADDAGPAGAALGGIDDGPRGPVRFVGRADEVRALTAEPGVWAVDGMAGVGKTTLAVHVARELAAIRPDGFLFLDLHGYSAGWDPLDPHAALGILLRKLGVDTDRGPEDTDERAARWRAELARRSLVVVLDNAAGADQVRPLLPGATGCTVVVSSRRRLVGLNGIRSLSLDVLTSAESRELFASIAGPARVTDTAADYDEVARLCGHLPLAMQVAAGRLHHRPAWTVGHLADRLRDESRRLGELDADGSGVAAALALSTRLLSEGDQRLFALLGLAFGPEVDAYQLAALADCDPAEAERFLEALVDVHLLQEPAAGRYRPHALTRDFARSRPLSPDPASGDADADAADAAAAAQLRLVDYFLAGSAVAFDLIDPLQTTDAVRPPAAGDRRRPPAPADATEARAWFDDNMPYLLCAARQAVKLGAPAAAVGLARNSSRYFQLGGRTADWLAMSELARQAADDAGVAADQAWAYLSVGAVHRRLGNVALSIENLRRSHEISVAAGPFPVTGQVLNALAVSLADVWQLEESTRRYLEAIAWAEEVGDRRGFAVAKANLAAVLVRQHDPVAALEHARVALATFETDGYDPGSTTALIVMGKVRRGLGDLDAAADSFRAALERAEQIGYTEMAAYAHSELATVHRVTGDLAAALEQHALAEQLVTDLGGHPDHAELLYEQSRTEQAAGEAALAEATAGRALAVAEAAGDPHHQALALALLSGLRQAGDPAAAAELAARAEALFQRLGPHARPVPEIRS